MECQVEKYWKFPTHFIFGAVCSIESSATEASRKRNFWIKDLKMFFFCFPEEKFDLYNEACSETSHFHNNSQNQTFCDNSRLTKKELADIMKSSFCYLYYYQTLSYTIYYVCRVLCVCAKARPELQSISVSLPHQ